MMTKKRNSFFGLLASMALTAACSGDDQRNETTDSNEEPPYFQVDRNATGPLTMAELKINIPDDIEIQLTDGEVACFMDAVASRAKDAGDPASIDPDATPYWDGRVSKTEWDDHSAHIQRVLLAQAVVSWAMIDCT